MCPLYPNLGVLAHSLAVHGILSEGHILHRPQNSVLLRRPGTQYLGVVSLQVLQLLHGEIDVQIPVKIFRVSGGERVSVDVNHWFLGVNIKD